MAHPKPTDPAPEPRDRSADQSQAQMPNQAPNQAQAQSVAQAMAQARAHTRAHSAAPDAQAGAGAAPAGSQAAGPARDGTTPEGTAAEGTGVDKEIDAIRREGLTGRQLRLARRVAQKHGLAPVSDFDAVRLLRKQGIDPFQRSNMLELVVNSGKPQPEGEVAEIGRAGLPQTVQPRNTLPSTEQMSPAERRAVEITAIQRDIARRRRRNLALMLTRLAVFVILPTVMAGWYFYKIATPMYATKSEFLILQAEASGGSGLGSLLSGTQFATNQDAIAVQSYLTSRDAMMRLENDLGFKAHFRQPWIDPLQRLDQDATSETAYKTFKKNVKIGYDPTEGVIRMEVVAADPEISRQFSKALIGYAEERVDNLSRRKRDDQMSEAFATFEKAEADRRAAQEQLVRLQQEGAILDPEGKIASLRSQISNIEVQLQEKNLQLSALLDNSRPNQSRVDGVRGDISRLEGLLAQLNASMTEAAQGENSLAQLSAQIQMAQADLATREMMLQSALQQMETTRIEANRQVRYLTTSVEPVAPDAATYPRSFENTVLAFLIFSGVYLMVSLTASILREQVSS